MGLSSLLSQPSPSPPSSMSPSPSSLPRKSRNLASKIVVVEIQFKIELLWANRHNHSTLLILYLYRNAVEWFMMVLRAVPAVLGWKKKQENLAGFLEKGILAQYHKYFANDLQLFWHKYLQMRHTNICNVLMQIFGWLTNMFGTLSHLQRQELRRTSPSQ